MNNIGYIPQIDGLRAVSIGMVLLTHANFQIGYYGIIGVDVFFAMSGFLITTLLMEEYNHTNTVRIGQFYLRRAIRLLPALFLLLVGVWIYTLLLSDPEKIQETRFEIFASTFYFYNVAWLFERVSQPVLGHMWSLAVEEQFYLVWPLLLTLFLRKSWARLLPYGLVGFVILSLFLKTSGTSSNIWNSLIHESLFMGCSFAVMRMYFSVPKIHRVWYLGSLLLLILIGVMAPPDSISNGKPLLHFTGGLLGLVAIAYCLQNQKDQLLGSQFLVYIGRISYSLYLWHVPIFKWFKWYSPLEPWQSFVLKFAVTFLISIISYQLIERPIIISAKRHFSKA